LILKAYETNVTPNTFGMHTETLEIFLSTLKVMILGDSTTWDAVRGRNRRISDNFLFAHLQQYL